MNRFLFLIVLLATALGPSGCAKHGEQRVVAPARTEPDVSDIVEARWITGEGELRLAAARASKSPLVQRAVLDVASDARVSLLPSGIVGGIGVMRDGSQVRITLLPFQYRDDSTHAAYVTLLEHGEASRAETFELRSSRTPTLLEDGFVAVNSGEHGLWLREGSVYLPSAGGIEVRRAPRAPERSKWATFIGCFLPLADRLLGQVQGACGAMGNFPGCVTIGSGISIIGAGVFCALVAMKS